MYSATIGSRRYAFADLATLLAKASPLRSGDCLAGLAAESGEERVAAQYALADLPLRTFLAEQVIPYETDEVTRLIVDSHDQAAFAPIAHLTVGGLRDWLLSDVPTAEALARLAAGITPEMAAAVSKISRVQDLMVMAAQVRRRHPLPQHDRAARPPVGAAAAQSSDRRRPRHCGQHPRRPAAGLGRRGDRHQPGDRQPGARLCPALDARRDQAQARDPDAKLRARARDHDARADPPGRAGRPGVPVDRRQRGRQQELRHRSRAPARGARGGAGTRARHRRRQRDVFRDRARQRAVGRRPSRRRPADLGGARLCGGAGVRAAAGQFGGRLHRARISVRRQADHPRRAWRTISAAS